MIKAVLFDMDGILYDSEAWYMKGTVAQMRAYGYTGPQEKIYAVIGTTMAGTFDILYDLLDHKISKEQLAADNDRYFLVDHPLNYRSIMFEGVPEQLNRLKSHGLKLACCSSSPEKTILDSLDAMGIRSCFDFVESGENVPQAKPAPDIYLLAMKALGCTSEECIVYEDSKAGIEAGIRAGCYTIAREDKRFNQDQSEASLIVRDIQGMADAVLKENK
ncbi:MAG: HAD family phosphatase [Solobacterium sp.]|jgi:HAD superfamily hydrolase (TIGR01509 family)|nr:HAD family phosphatase [Solobacterium sp.]MCH4222764.1 HAD family phosphatase [Solobacterium sp.]MCH4265973.1 HAD family phosphatase [Solobacterium sp.]